MAHVAPLCEPTPQMQYGIHCNLARKLHIIFFFINGRKLFLLQVTDLHTQKVYTHHAHPGTSSPQIILLSMHIYTRHVTDVGCKYA